MPLAKEQTKQLFTHEDVSEIALLVGTKKGAFIYYSNHKRLHWEVNGPHFLGSIIHHMVMDPRDNKTILVSAKTGHLGPTIYRSTTLGKTWIEATSPPAFHKSKDTSLVVDNTFWLTPGHTSEPNVWYAGTSPQGLFRSEDGGDTWIGIDGFNKHPKRSEWIGDISDGTPDGPKLHSILIDPRDKNHMYISMSGGGTFESTDQGETWNPLNKGVVADFIPGPTPEFGQDPHCVVFNSNSPDTLYQQNHCGIYKIERPQDTWTRIGDNMPADIGDIGFPIVVHPRDPNTIWVFPMDSTDVWPRVSPDGHPAVYCSNNAGESWFRQDIGLPLRQAWFTVLRQAMTHDHLDSLGLYFGTSSGTIWISDNEGNSWRQLAIHLPYIYSLEVGYIPK
jgi:hypothetical protein